MYNSNDFLEKCILSLYEGELLGNVNKLHFDKKIKKLVEIEVLGDNDTKYNLATKNIYHVGKNAITVKNNQMVDLKVEETNLALSPIGSKAYSINGEYLGIIKEISLDDKYCVLKFSLDNNRVLDYSSLATSGKNSLIFNLEEQKININKFKAKTLPKIFKNNAPQIAKILPEINNKNDIQEIIQKIPENTINKQTSQCQNSDFLIGRICTKDIFNFNNEILIKNHAIISKKNLKEINKFGKLRELMLFSK